MLKEFHWLSTSTCHTGRSPALVQTRPLLHTSIRFTRRSDFLDSSCLHVKTGRRGGRFVQRLKHFETTRDERQSAELNTTESPHLPLHVLLPTSAPHSPLSHCEITLCVCVCVKNNSTKTPSRQGWEANKSCETAPPADHWLLPELHPHCLTRRGSHMSAVRTTTGGRREAGRERQEETEKEKRHKERRR